MHQAGIANIDINESDVKAQPVGEYFFLLGVVNLLDKDNKAIDANKWVNICSSQLFSLHA